MKGFTLLGDERRIEMEKEGRDDFREGFPYLRSSGFKVIQ